MVTSPHASLVGTLVDGRYLFEEYLGGSMAHVYRGSMYGAPGARAVVLKQLRLGANDGMSDEERRRLFDQEYEVLRRMDHPRVPRVIERFSDPHGRSFIVMDYVPGQTLDRFLVQSNSGAPSVPPETQVLDWMDQLCGILQYLHGLRVIYRDLKPTNVIAASDDAIHLIDFGIARTYKPGQRHDTVYIGTQNYSAYELLIGADQASAVTDVYALGATMYHLLTGELPRTALQLRANGATCLPSARLLNAAVSADTDAIIQRATQMLPSDRFATVDAMAVELRACRQASAAIRVSCPVCRAGNRSSARFCAECGCALVAPAGAVLRVLGQSGALLEVALARDKTEFLIGRAAAGDGLYPDLDLSAIDSKYVSRRHAAIQRTVDGWSVIDYSRNGTFINGVRLDHQASLPLSAGDLLTVGDVSLQFEVTR